MCALIEFTTVNKHGVERFLLSIDDAILLGETKNGCCVQRRDDGCVFDAVNSYDDVKKVLVANGIAVIELPVPKSEDLKTCKNV